MLLSLIGNTAAGYRTALTSSRQLLTVLLPILAAALLTLTVLDVLVGRFSSAAGTIIVNGMLQLPEAGWWRRVVIAAFWLVALSAATLVAIGDERGYAVRPHRAILAALRHFPVVAAGFVAIVGITGLGLWMVSGIGSGYVTLALVIAVLLAGALTAGRLLIGLAAHQLGGSDWALTRGRVVPTAGAFLLGGIVIPLLASSLFDGLVGRTWAAWITGVVASLLVVAVQAGTLAYVYLLQRPASLTPSLSPGASVDLAAVDARLGDYSDPDPGSPSRLLTWAGVAAVVLAVLAPGGVALANPFDAPVLRTHDRSTSGPVAVAWPAGKHPVIATMSGAWFCETDLCDRFIDQNGGPSMWSGRGAAGISADGNTVLKASLSGGEENGGPFIHYARCTRSGCPEAYVPVRRSAREKFEWAQLGAAVAPDQALWFVLAAAQDKTFRISFIRCPEIGCKTPQRYDGGTIERLTAYEDATDDSQIRLTVGADGRPLATVRTGSEASQVTCEPVTCAKPRSVQIWVGDPGSVWAAPASLGGLALSWEQGMLRVGENILDAVGGPQAPETGAVAARDGVYYATAVEKTTKPGFHVTIGGSSSDSGVEGESSESSTADYWQQVLWRCGEWHCTRQPLDTFGFAYSEHEVMAVSDDGRVLIVRQDRMLLLTR
ncbi:hypothetical protein FB565_007951 [Actinoplanes lutulentus]|uniref:Uncharacterized protein n=1 Tax=Actinoplanes lutulentus TaxID=1287878 RepID=A0A327ZD20_9ACTN|nr:hypothetical protein [Actinoplanes lutulentus]MBB2948168.1 hypothetical protein [Actinoplanes lutulentus]RAK31332.1 hypothetical protein B0I29_115138 [Actinoplanes lutulentus]